MPEAAARVLAPLARPHDEDPDRRPGGSKRRALPFEKAIEPLQMELTLEVGDRHLGPELHLPGVRARIRAVHPWADHEMDGRRQVLTEADIVLESPAAVGIVPARHEEHREVCCRRVMLGPVDVELLEVRVVVPVGHHGQDVVFEARRHRKRVEPLPERERAQVSCCSSKAPWFRILWSHPFERPPMLTTIVLSAGGRSFAALAWACGA